MPKAKKTEAPEAASTSRPRRQPARNVKKCNGNTPIIEEKKSKPKKTASAPRKKLPPTKKEIEEEDEEIIPRRKSIWSNINGNINLMTARVIMEMGWKSKSVKGLVSSVVGEKLLALEFTQSDMQRERVTALDWHPRYPNIYVAASKHGHIRLCDANATPESPSSEELNVGGTGPGYTINTVRFNSQDPEHVYVASMAGTFMKIHFSGRSQKFLSSADPMALWYLSFDINQEKSVMAAGDTLGNLSLVGLDGTIAGRYKIHKSAKIASIEFSKRDPNILCTASNDKVVRLWDIRKINAIKPQAVHSLQHQCPINYATFSKTDGCRLLTTDQCETLNVYSSSLFEQERTIKHPHRFFQYLTPIRGTWHPLADLITIGRYPDKDGGGGARTVDIIDANSGEIAAELLEKGVKTPQIKTINEWNVDGSMLASTAGRNVMIWKGLIQNLCPAHQAAACKNSNM